MVSSTPRSHFTPGKDPVPILQETGWAPGPVWTGGKSRPHRNSIPDRPARSQSLYRLSYPVHTTKHTYMKIPAQWYRLLPSYRPYIDHESVTLTTVKVHNAAFVGAFARLRKATVSFVMSVRPSGCPHGTIRLPLDGFS